MVLGALITLVGAVLTYAGARQAMGVIAFTSSAVETKGAVVENRQYGTGQHATYRAVIEYRTDGGQVQRIVDTVGTNPPRFVVDQQVDVLYPPEHPEQGRLPSFMSLWLSPLAGCAAGALGLLVGIGAFSSAYRAWRRGPVGTPGYTKPGTPEWWQRKRP